MTERAARLRQALVGWVYPPVCGSCEIPISGRRHLEVPFLCEKCESTLVPVGNHYCAVCGQGFELTGTTSFRCANCGDRELAVDFVVSAYRGTGVSKRLMHQFKYGKQIHLARLFGVLLDEVWRDERLRERDWWVVPVPLHPRRRRERGFNQSQELARELVRRAPKGVSLSLHPLLKRVKQTVRQAQLDRQERLTNLSSVFAAKSATSSNPDSGVGILLVDDVITTGTTVSECSSTLRGFIESERFAAVSVLRG